MKYIVAALLLAIPVCVGEILNRFENIHNEYSRKVVHILSAVVAALLVVFFSLEEIAVYSLLSIPVLVLLRFSKRVHSLYEITRISYGELFFPAGVAAAALVADTTLAYVYAVLILGFADASASLVGEKLRRGEFKIIGNIKSIVGSIAFCAMAILVGAALLTASGNTHLVLLALPLAVVLAVSEMFLVYGTDNFIVPLFAAVLMNAVLVLS